MASIPIDLLLYLHKDSLFQIPIRLKSPTWYNTKYNIWWLMSELTHNLYISNMTTNICIYAQAFDSPCINRKNPKLLVFTRFPVLVNEVDQENNVSGSTRSIFRHSRTLSLLWYELGLSSHLRWNPNVSSFYNNIYWYACLYPQFVLLLIISLIFHLVRSHGLIPQRIIKGR